MEVLRVHEPMPRMKVLELHYALIVNCFIDPGYNSVAQTVPKVALRLTSAPPLAKTSRFVSNTQGLSHTTYTSSSSARHGLHPRLSSSLWQAYVLSAQLSSCKR